MIQLIGGLLLACYLPGALVFRLSPAPARGVFDRGERIYWHVMLSVAITLAIALGLAVLGEYRLERVLVGDALVAGAAVLLGLRRWRRGTNLLRGTGSIPAAGPRTRAVEGAWLAVPAALIALCAWLYPPPAEYVLGGKDPGVYMNAGVQMPSCTAVTTAFRQASCALAVASAKYGASSRLSRLLFASNASLMCSRKRARIMQPPRHNSAIEP